MTDENDTDDELQLTDGAHIASEHDRENEWWDGPPTKSAEDTPLSSITNTAGVDQPDPSLRDKDELDAWGGKEVSEEASSTVAPQGEARENTFQDQIDWLLPDETDKDGGRTGILSTHIEVHAFAIGITAGAHFGLSGDAQLINDVVGVGLLGDRVRRANVLPEQYLEQAQEELPHFLGGVVVGTVATQFDVAGQLADMGIGV